MEGARESGDDEPDALPIAPIAAEKSLPDPNDPLDTTPIARSNSMLAILRNTLIMLAVLVNT